MGQFGLKKLGCSKSFLNIQIFGRRDPRVSCIFLVATERPFSLLFVCRDDESRSVGDESERNLLQKSLYLMKGFTKRFEMARWARSVRSACGVRILIGGDK